MDDIQHHNDFPPLTIDWLRPSVKNSATTSREQISPNGYGCYLKTCPDLRWVRWTPGLSKWHGRRTAVVRQIAEAVTHVQARRSFHRAFLGRGDWEE